MLEHLARAVVPAILAGVCALPAARADIYSWVDASGRVTFSNLAPPDGVQVTGVVRETAPGGKAREDAAREAARRAEVQALAERVRQLEDEMAGRSAPAAPPAVQYVVVPPPPVQVVVASPPAVQYVPAPIVQAAPACDPLVFGCPPWIGPGFYGAGFVVVHGGASRRSHGIAGRHPVTQRPLRSPWMLHRR